MCHMLRNCAHVVSCIFRLFLVHKPSIPLFICFLFQALERADARVRRRPYKKLTDTSMRNTLKKSYSAFVQYAGHVSVSASARVLYYDRTVPWARTFGMNSWYTLDSLASCFFLLFFLLPFNRGVVCASVYQNARVLISTSLVDNRKAYGLHKQRSPPPRTENVQEQRLLLFVFSNRRAGAWLALGGVGAALSFTAPRLRGGLPKKQIPGREVTPLLHCLRAKAKRHVAWEASNHAALSPLATANPRP